METLEKTRFLLFISIVSIFFILTIIINLF